MPHPVIYDASTAVQVQASTWEEAREKADATLSLDEHEASRCLSQIAGVQLDCGLGNPVLVIDIESHREYPLPQHCCHQTEVAG